MIDIKLEESISYRYVDLPGRPRLHFIWGGDVDLFSVSVAVAYGSVHLAFRDESGAVRTTQRGTPHFMEHLLTRTSLKELGSLESRYGAVPNAVVIPEQSIWYAKYGVAEDKRLAHAICDVISVLIASLCPETERALGRIAYTESDVLAEIEHRHYSLLYPFRVAAMSALYHTHPIRFDPLGDRHSIMDIRSDDVETALRVIRNSISHITVVGVEPTDEVIEAVKDTVLGGCVERAGDALVPAVEHPEPPQPKNRILGVPIQEPDTNALVCLAIKLTPFYYGDAPSSETACKRVLTYLLSREMRLGFTGVINSGARAWFASGYEEDTTFFMDAQKQYEVIQRLRMRILDSLTLSPRQLAMKIESAWGTIIETQGSLLRICNAASRFGHSLSEFASILSRINVDDLNDLKVEVEVAEAKENISLIFASPFADLL